MKTVFLITERFPYLPGEQFLEPELDFWGARADVNLVVMPLKGGTERRSLPPSVSLSLQLSEKPKWREKGKALARALFSTAWLREVRYLLRIAVLRPATAKAALHALYLRNVVEQRLRPIVKASAGVSIIYTYWNSPATYAAACMRREVLVERVVTRVHGFDLYEERRAYGYMPFVRQYMNDIDQICPISRAGAAYLTEKYGVDKGRVAPMALGVGLPACLAAPSPPGCFNVLTLSSCVQVKRLDKVIEALALLSKRLPSTKIKWSHIGDGPLKQALECRANERFAGTNVSAVFLGALDHEKVFEFFERNPLDILLNASDSEGIPVSVMEAMSYGVPVVAPDVGGVSEIVRKESGFLLPNKPTPEEVSGALFEMFFLGRKPSFREAAREFVENNYSAEKNFQRFIVNVIY